MNRLYGGVCAASIDTDSELKYPKGAGRVSFVSQESFVQAISDRFVNLQCGESDKRASFCLIASRRVCLLPYNCCLILGWSKTVCSWWPDVWHLSRKPTERQSDGPVLLRQPCVFAVFLRVLLEELSFSGGQRFSQAVGQGRHW